MKYKTIDVTSCPLKSMIGACNAEDRGYEKKIWNETLYC